MNLAALAVAFADHLETTTGLKATADPRIASTRAGVLVGPPTHNYAEKLTTWTLVVLAGRDARDLRTFEVLAEILEAIDTHYPLEEARPATYTLTSDQPPVPAYLCRVTTSN